MNRIVKLLVGNAHMNLWIAPNTLSPPQQTNSCEALSSSIAKLLICQITLV